VQDPVNKSQAEGYQGIGRPQHDSIDQLLKKEDHRSTPTKIFEILSDTISNSKS
jgi:hypothetical protein